MTANTTYGPKVTVTRSCSDCPACETKQYREQGDSGTDWTCAHPSLEKPRYIGIFSTTPDWCPVASPSAQPSGAPEVQPVAQVCEVEHVGAGIKQTVAVLLRDVPLGTLLYAPLATAPTPSGAPADTTKALRELVDVIDAEPRPFAPSRRAWFDRLEKAQVAGRAALAAPSAQPTVPEVTPEMVQAYRKANDAYWKRMDEQPTPPNKWRTGTPAEATAESLRAALAFPSAQPPRTLAEFVNADTETKQRIGQEVVEAAFDRVDAVIASAQPSGAPEVQHSHDEYASGFDDGRSQAEKESAAQTQEVQNLHEWLDQIGAPRNCEDGWAPVPWSLRGRVECVLMKPKPDTAPTPSGAPADTTKARFENVSCSQCGGEFGPGNEGISHCSDHAPVFTKAHVDAVAEIIQQMRDSIGAGGLAETAQYERSIVGPYLDNLQDELDGLAALAGAPAVQDATPMKGTP